MYGQYLILGGGGACRRLGHAVHAVHARRRGLGHAGHAVHARRRGHAGGASRGRGHDVSREHVINVGRGQDCHRFDHRGQILVLIGHCTRRGLHSMEIYL